MPDVYSEELVDFVRESNRIEGIHRDPYSAELAAHELFLALPTVGIDDLRRFVYICAGATLRDQAGMNVRVGAHFPPPGGPEIAERLTALLASLEPTAEGAFITHVAYEDLHPFNDGNGRSGRALWAWQMKQAGLDPFALPFLHRFYYQTLTTIRAAAQLVGEASGRIQ